MSLNRSLLPTRSSRIEQFRRSSQHREAPLDVFLREAPSGSPRQPGATRKEHHRTLQAFEVRLARALSQARVRVATGTRWKCQFDARLRAGLRCDLSPVAVVRVPAQALIL